MSTIKKIAHQMKLDSSKMAASSIELRNKALLAVKSALLENKDLFFEANKEDLAKADEAGIADSVKKRLKFNDGKLNDCISGIDSLLNLADPIGKVTLKRELDENLILTRLTVPIGVIGVIFEARPDALVQISCLCIKSGNCAILKGGKETAKTNRALFKVIYDAVIAAGLPAGCLTQAEAHSEIDELLTCEKDVDLLIPRGSNKFVQYIMNNTKIPVMGHADGICHIYLDKEADVEKAKRIIVDAKTQYTAACNATETLLINREKANEILPIIAKELVDNNVKLRGTREAADVLDGFDVEIMDEDEFNTEYLNLTISLKLVDGVEEAVDHINKFGSHHTDAIITENDTTAHYFSMMVDSAGVYRNCSTRFADGFRYGFGAEVGISTSKLHARGPVGLEGLVTYKYTLEGNGQIVGDYASGASTFTHKDLM